MSPRVILLLLVAGVAFARASTARAADPAPKKPPQSAPAPAPKPKASGDSKAKAEPTPAPDAGPGEDPKSKGAKDDPNLGMSILGNQEAPKSLVIVPWKSSDVGKSVDLSTLLDDSTQPIDKEVFMRMLSYYELRSTSTHGRKQ